MAHPLRFLNSLTTVGQSEPLGELLTERVINSGWITTLLDCFPQTARPALHSPVGTHEPLTHVQLRECLANFALPFATLEKRLGPNDRVLILLPDGPLAALAVLSVMCYHTAVPVPLSCTQPQLWDTVERLSVKAILTTAEAEGRLQLRGIQEKFGLEIVFLQSRQSGAAGLFDLTLMQDHGMSNPRRTYRSSKLQSLADQSLLLHSAGTHGTVQMVPYSTRTLIISACAVIKTWDLRETDTNSKSPSKLQFFYERMLFVSEYAAFGGPQRSNLQPRCASDGWRKRRHAYAFRCG